MSGALLSYLRHVLTAPVTITGAESWHRPRGMVGHETIVWFPKVLFVAHGAVDYEVDGRTLAIPAGHLLYRPAWTRSRWRSTHKLAMSFCEFDFPTAGVLWREPLVVKAGDAKREGDAMGRIVALFADGDEAAILEAAGELKALLARMFSAAARGNGTLSAGAPPHPAIDHAIQYLSQRYGRADALDDLHERAGLGINRFRTLFKQQLGLTPQSYVLLLRMRAARYYLTDARLPLKQVSLAVGYEDPLYFSRVYRKFWGHPPTQDRNRPAAGAKPPTPYTAR
jgi:AraC-like DNA-binding protein